MTSVSVSSRAALPLLMARLQASATSGFATAALLGLLLGVPVLFVQRFGSGPLPLQPIDALLIGALALWSCLVEACAQREEVLHRRPFVPWVIYDGAHRLVEASAVGVGPVVLGDVRAANSSDLAASVPFAELDPTELPVPLFTIGPQPADGDRYFKGRQITAVVPAISAPEVSRVLEEITTADHVVVRGETFWSLALEHLGDGCQWELIRSLNVGREVASGVVMARDDVLRVGWNVLVPARAEGAES